MNMEANDNAVSTVITQSHMNIGHSLALRVVDILQRQGLMIQSYQVHAAINSYDSDTESVTIKVNDLSTLSIQLKTSSK